MACNPAAQVQGPGPDAGDGHPFDVNIISTSTCVPVRACADTTATRTLVANNTSTAGIDVEGKATLRIRVTGVFGAGFITVSGSNDGVIWSQISFTVESLGALPVLSIQAGFPAIPDLWEIPTAGLLQVRFNAVGGFAGALTFETRASVWASVISISSPIVHNSFGSSASDSESNSFEVFGTPEFAEIGYKCFQLVFGGTSWERPRTPKEFKTVAAVAAGNTALWTPAAGRRFRLMRYMVTVTGDASFAAAANLTVSLFDGAAGATGQVHDIYIPLAAAAVPGENYVSPWIDLGNGFLSTAVNNVLNVNLSAALATGLVRVTACGTEE